MYNVCVHIWTTVTLIRLLSSGIFELNLSFYWTYLSLVFVLNMSSLTQHAGVKQSHEHIYSYSKFDRQMVWGWPYSGPAWDHYPKNSCPKLQDPTQTSSSSNRRVRLCLKTYRFSFSCFRVKTYTCWITCFLVRSACFWPTRLHCPQETAMVELVVRFAHYEHYQHILALVSSHRVNLAPGLLFSHIFRAEKQQIYKFAFVFDDRQSCLILCEVQVNRDFTHL